MTLTADRLRLVLNYDPGTGVFTWRERTGRGARNDRTGCVAGTPHKDGYLAITVDGRKYLAHRLAWFHVYGRWPADETDHRNRVRSDNRIDNLREGTRSFNQQNRTPAATHPGVDFHKGTGKWRARVGLNGRSHLVGYFEDPEAASAARLATKRQLHPGNTL